LLRTILHHIRKAAHRILGTSHIYNQGALAQTGTDQEFTLFAQKIFDRITRLESQMNWRNLGEPTSLGNLKLEQLATLNDQGLLQDLCTKLSKTLRDPDEENQYKKLILDSYSKQIVVSSCSTLGGSKDNTAIYLLDPHDLITTIQARQTNLDYLVKVGPLTYLQALDSREPIFIWLSDFLHRSDPLTSMLTLLYCIKNLASGSKVAGYAKANPQDPRVVKEFDIAWAIKFQSDLNLRTEGSIFEFTIR